MSLYIGDRDRQDESDSNANENLPRWVMPKNCQSLEFAYLNDKRIFVQSVHYYYLVLCVGRDENKSKQYPVAGATDGTNYIASNGIALPLTEYSLSDIPDSIRKQDSDGDEIIIVNATTGLGKEVLYIEGGGISAGHFVIDRKRLIFYDGPDDVKKNIGKKNQYIALTQRYCSYFEGLKSKLKCSNIQ